MKDQQLERTVQAALFAAMACVATLVLQIPSPMGGYINLGDAIVLLAAFLLGPVYGCAAAGLGSMLADLLSGYAIYAPGTLIIKAACALLASLLLVSLRNKGIKNIPALVLAGLAGEAVMVLGYFAYAALIMGRGLAATASIPGNLAQAGAGILLSTLLYGRLSELRFFKRQ